MNLRRLSGRVVAAGAVSALAAGALVGVGASAAQAAPVGVGYNCLTALSPDPLLVFVDPTGTLPSDLEAGKAVPAGTLDLPVDVTVPRKVLDGMAPFGINKAGISSSNFALGVGGTSLKLTGLTTQTADVPATGDLLLTAPSTNGAFTPPAAGTYDVTMPSSFAASVATNVLNLPVDCTIADAATATIGSVTVAEGSGNPDPDPVMQDSATTAKAPKSVKQGKAVKISVAVATAEPATGKVTAKEKTKTLGSAVLKSGKATITVKGLKPGKHTITVSYAGDDSTNGSKSKAVTVKVIKKKKHKK